MGKRHLLALFVLVALISAACGGNSEDTNPAAFGGGSSTPSDVCEQVPVSVPGITVNGQRVKSIEQVEVCVQADTAAGVIPVVNEQPECGNPCLTVEITGLNVEADTGVRVRLVRDGEPEEIEYDLDPVTVGNAERWCLVGIGTPDPCTGHLTRPTSLTAQAGRAAGLIKLTWGASRHTAGEEVTGYEVYRSETGEPGSFTPIVSVSETSHKDVGLTSGTTYHYYVIALDGSGQHSKASNVAQATAK